MSNLLALVIEDDWELATIFAAGLQAAEFETEIFQNGQSALDRLGEIVPALVILDLHLPFVSGRDILRQIKADARLAETKVIVTTADAAAAEALQNQADFALVKPVGPTHLLNLATQIRSTTSV